MAGACPFAVTLGTKEGTGVAPCLPALGSQEGGCPAGWPYPAGLAVAAPSPLSVCVQPGEIQGVMSLVPPAKAVTWKPTCFCRQNSSCSVPPTAAMHPSAGPSARACGGPEAALVPSWPPWLGCCHTGPRAAGLWNGPPAVSPPQLEWMCEQHFAGCRAMWLTGSWGHGGGWRSQLEGEGQRAVRNPGSAQGCHSRPSCPLPGPLPSLSVLHPGPNS